MRTQTHMIQCYLCMGASECESMRWVKLDDADEQRVCDECFNDNMVTE